MKQIRRRTARAILVPFALFVIVLGGALPANAAPPDRTPATSIHFVVSPLSLSW
jgi:hypothetical protein